MSNHCQLRLFKSIVTVCYCDGRCQYVFMSQKQTYKLDWMQLRKTSVDHVSCRSSFTLLASAFGCIEHFYIPN